MKTYPISLLFIILATIPLAQADGLEGEIKSGDYCESVIYDKFKLIEKTEHQKVKFRPSPRLLEFAVSMELMCPWGTERDYNGDKKPDWIGFVKINEKYELLAYLSTSREYQVTTISSFASLPTKKFIRWIQSAHLKRFTEKKLNISYSRYALQVADVDGLTDIYLWDGKKMAKILTTSQLF
jgi:hypothetical protein